MLYETDTKNLIPFLEKALNYAKEFGADQSEISASYTTGFITTVRKQIVDSLENTQDKSISINVYCNKHKGSSSTSDFSDDAIKMSVKRACEIAKFTSKDKFAGLADIKYLTPNNLNLDLYHPWKELNTLKAIDIATECEAHALSNKQISNTEGATIESYNSVYAQANSHGFMH
ncbi:MAG: PmbA protein, partial [Francisellaceae bacterium]